MSVSPALVERVRAGSRRPIPPDQVAALVALGAELRILRENLGLSRRVLSAGAEVSEGHLARIEWGARRTRASTLRRITAALVAAAPELGGADELTDWLVEVAGPSLAPESPYAERIAKRRARRHRKADRLAIAATPMAETMAQELAKDIVSERIRQWRWLMGLRVYRAPSRDQ
jgi:transcriptional regulator with XRE-family HTH domain